MMFFYLFLEVITLYVQLIILFLNFKVKKLIHSSLTYNFIFLIQVQQLNKILVNLIIFPIIIIQILNQHSTFFPFSLNSSIPLSILIVIQIRHSYVSYHQRPEITYKLYTFLISFNFCKNSLLFYSSSSNYFYNIYLINHVLNFRNILLIILASYDTVCFSSIYSNGLMTYTQLINYITDGIALPH